MSSFIADTEPEKPNKNAPSLPLPNGRGRGLLKADAYLRSGSYYHTLL
jgi:hypothetical protein